MGFNENLKLLLLEKNMKLADLCRMADLSFILLDDVILESTCPEFFFTWQESPTTIFFLSWNVIKGALNILKHLQKGMYPLKKRPEKGRGAKPGLINMGLYLYHFSLTIFSGTVPL